MWPKIFYFIYFIATQRTGVNSEALPNPWGGIAGVRSSAAGAASTTGSNSPPFSSE